METLISHLLVNYPQVRLLDYFCFVTFDILCMGFSLLGGFRHVSNQSISFLHGVRYWLRLPCMSSLCVQEEDEYAGTKRTTMC
jgi:hypothetical protein